MTGTEPQVSTEAFAQVGAAPYPGIDPADQTLKTPKSAGTVFAIHNLGTTTHWTMGVERLTVLVLTASFFSCAHDHDAEVAMPLPLRAGSAGGPEDTQRPDHTGPHERSAGVGMDAIEFDIVQRTCALYVAVRSGAWEGPVAFGGDLDDTMVRWNMCPGGTMVACASVSTATGDTAQAGIPWPYGSRL